MNELPHRSVDNEKGRRHYLLFTITIIIGLFFTSACRQDMADQPRYDPLEESKFFASGQASRPLIEGTVARGQLRDDKHLYTGFDGDKPVDTFPFPITQEVLKRGQERFNIYCSVCHDRIGNGEGMIVQRGFRKPPSFHIERLRKEPVGHFYDVMTNGFGAMASYSAQVNVRDRWAITAYIRALQASQPVAPTPATATSVAPTGSTTLPPTTPTTQATPAPTPTAPATSTPAPTTTAPQNGKPGATGTNPATDKGKTTEGKPGTQGAKQGVKVDTGGQQR